jgi:hypothetical protein
MLTTVHIINSAAAVPLEDEYETPLALTHPPSRETVVR